MQWSGLGPGAGGGCRAAISQGGERREGLETRAGAPCEGGAASAGWRLRKLPERERRKSEK